MIGTKIARAQFRSHSSLYVYILNRTCPSLFTQYIFFNEGKYVHSPDGTWSEYHGDSSR